MQSLSRLEFFLLALIVYSLIGCNPERRITIPEYEVSPTWSPKDVRLVCENDAQCPDNQGVLLSYRHSIENYGSYQILHTLVGYCTASLYGPDQIITAGHCLQDLGKFENTWFISVNKTSRPSQMFEADVSSATFTVSDFDSPDFGAIKLHGGATASRYMHSAGTRIQTQDHLIALVTDTTEPHSVTHLVLRALKCTFLTNKDFPYDMAGNLDVFKMQECLSLKGNSGGALVQPGDLTAVNGIVAFGPSWADPETTTTSDLRTRAPLGAVFAGITNVDCITLPNWPAPNPSCHALRTTAKVNAEY